jgi:signal transduction histidine kinase
MNRLSIRWKLVLVTLMTSAIAQLFAGLILAVYDSRTFESQKTREVGAEAAILASSVTASLAFGDAKAAREYLGALKANPEIDAAAIYGPEGTVFANYSRAGPDTPAVPDKVPTYGDDLQGNHLSVVVPVVEDQNSLGTVYLLAAVEPAGQRFFRYSLIILGALSLSLIVAIPVSMRLNRTVSDPIRDIAAAARRITDGDLAHDLPTTGRQDEIGLLMRAFGQMVAGLREMTSELERRVAHRTAELEAANRELESFSYSVSHDLRAPLRAIDGFALMIEEDYADRLDDEGRRLLSVVRDSARRMGVLIDELLAFSKFGRQAIHLAPTDMAALVREVWAEVERGAATATVDFRLSALPAAAADRPLLRQVWMNLLSNAAKYSGGNAHPVVEVVGEETDRDIVYRVKDNGAGFDMKYYDKLFGVFQRLHSAAEFPGTGVGLAIVQRIIIRHGGQVWAEGKVGNGATFFFSLPKGAVPSHAA